MYVNVYKASSYSYTEKNFSTLDEAKDFLNISDWPEFKENCSGELSAKVKGWSVTIKNEDMPHEGDGYVNMLEESGALDYLY